MTPQEALEKARKARDKRLKEIGGCTNRGCLIFSESGGLTTNAVCSCLEKDRYSASRVINAERIYIDEINTIIEAALPQWRDMETAPKDGTVILCASHNEFLGWYVKRGSWKTDDFTDEEGWFDEHYNDFNIGSSYNPLKPIKWMPLPQVEDKEND